MNQHIAVAAPESGPCPDTPASDSADADSGIPSFEELAADPEIAALLPFTPVHRQVKRKDGWTPDLQRELIARIAFTGTLQEAVRQMGKHASGAETLYKTPAAHSFRVAWDSALAIGRRRNGLDSRPPFTGEVPGITRRRRKAPAPAGGGPLPGQVLNEYGEWEDEAAYARRADEARDSIGMKLVRCRRAFLAEISCCPGKRAAFEILTELPVDWGKAQRLEPQPFEPWASTNQRQPDMVLTAESGWSWGGIGYGPDRIAEAQHAIDAYRAERGLPPVDWSESAEAKPTDGEAGASSGTPQ